MWCGACGVVRLCVCVVCRGAFVCVCGMKGVYVCVWFACMMWCGVVCVVWRACARVCVCVRACVRVCGVCVRVCAYVATQYPTTLLVNTRRRR